MGYNICTCLTDNCDYNQDLTPQNSLNPLETQLSSTKILYLNSLSSNNYSKSNRQKLLLNSINYTNYDTITNLNINQQFNQTDNKTILSGLAIKSRQENGTPYLDYNTLTKYTENINLLNKICAVFRGYALRKKYDSEILDKLISFEQKLIYKYNQKVIKNNQNLEKSINLFSDKILDYQNSWKKYYDKKPEIHNNNNYKIIGSKMMKYNKSIKNNKYKNECYFKVDEYNKGYLKEISSNEKIEYLINNIKSFYDGETDIINCKIKNGYGILLQNNGEKKVGTWNNNIFEGWNYYIDNNGTLYIGFFVNGKLNGKGESYDLNGTIYTGDFINNKPEGNGKETNNIFIYEGEFKNGKKEGKGKIFYKNNGDWYEGRFENDNFNGGGHYVWNKNGYEYFGNYKNGIIDGNGIFKYGDKAIYKGEFKNGLKEGKGELITKNNKIIGEFKNDLPHGKGYLEDNKGFKGYVNFNEGKIIDL